MAEPQGMVASSVAGGSPVTFVANGVEFLRLTETTQDILTFNNAGVDIDYSFLAASSVQSLFLDGANGRAGMNTTAPLGVWHTRGLIGAAATWYLDSFGAGNADFSIRQADGTVSAPTVTPAGRNISRQLMYGYDGAAYKAAAEIRVIARGTIGSDRVPGAFLFFTAEDAAGSALQQRISLETTAGTFNEDAADYDWRWEGTSNINGMVFDFGVASLGVGTATFDATGRSVLAMFTGTAPGAGLADTVQFYSTDNSAGHTIPSFFCEGTEVVATGQADSASSVRVLMRFQGTVRTFLCI